MRFPPEPWALPCFLTGPPPPVSCLFHLYEPSFQLLLEPEAANARWRAGRDCEPFGLSSLSHHLAMFLSQFTESSE